MVMSALRLVAFDLDGTLTRGLTCLEALAQRFDVVDQVARWEQARSEAEITAVRQGVWHLLGARAIEDQAGHFRGISLAPGAAEGIRLLHQAGVQTVIVSLAFEIHVRWFARLLGIDHVIATEVSNSGTFQHVFPSTKPTLLAGHAATVGVDLSETAAVGDSFGDVPMLAAVGTSVYLGSAPPEGFTATWHLPHAGIDAVADRLLNNR